MVNEGEGHTLIVMVGEYWGRCHRWDMVKHNQVEAIHTDRHTLTTMTRTLTSRELELKFYFKNMAATKMT